MTRKTSKQASRISEIWLRGIKEPEIRTKFEEAVRFNIESSVTKRLKQILLETKEQVLRQERKQYDTPSWAFEQAHRNGYLEALQLIEDLLTVREN
jgi:hypothetical protein